MGFAVQSEHHSAARTRRRWPGLKLWTMTLKLPAPDLGLDSDVCGHWHRVPIHITEIDYALYKIIGSDVIVGGYCPDCNETFARNSQII